MSSTLREPPDEQGKLLVDAFLLDEQNIRPTAIEVSTHKESPRTQPSALGKQGEEIER